MRILFFGDIVGRSGRDGVKKCLPKWQDDHQPDVVIANGENVAGGVGIAPDQAQELFDSGIDIITLGNHAWQRKEVYKLLDTDERLIRPINVPPVLPGRGYNTFSVKQAGKAPIVLAVVSLGGKVFLPQFDDPFRAISAVLTDIKTPFILVDFHAEATSEKVAMGCYLDGKVSAVVGTHTHVTTADETVLEGGTAYITDVGMCGAVDSIIGMDKEIVLRKFTTMLPIKFEVATGSAIISAVLIDLDDYSGRATNIVRLSKKY